MLNGSQAGSCVNVIVGVTDGIVVAVEDGNVEVAMTFVLLTIGVSIDWGFAQDTRISSSREVKIHFIRFLAMAKGYRNEPSSTYEKIDSFPALRLRSPAQLTGDSLRSAREH